MLQHPVREYLVAHREQFLEKYFELLRIPSIANSEVPPGTPHPTQTTAEWLVDYLRNIGLQGEVRQTAGRPCVVGSAHVSDELPTVLIYAHFDVQPPDPIEPWESSPFEPVIKDDAVYARGASDDKGQLFAHLMAIEAWKKAGGELPVNVKLLFEGEEEIGSPSLEAFLTEHKDELSADAAVISDGAFYSKDLPSITYALRGLLYLEITLIGAKQDVHSGRFGGMLANPINSLAKLVAGMHDENNRVTIPGFYDDVPELTDTERAEWETLPFDEAALTEQLGVDVLAGGEKGLSALERCWGRPTLDCNGIVGGYTGPGSKTIIPSSATVKITTRLVPNQNPQRIAEGFRRFLDDNTPPGMKSDATILAKARPVLLTRNSPAVEVAKSVYLQTFGKDPVFIRCGATVPITELIQRIFKLDPVLMCFGLPDDNLHGPNEHFALDQLWRGAEACALFLQEAASALTTPKG